VCGKGLEALLPESSHSSCLCAGLAHLHSQSPRLIHKDFKTANVLFDANHIAKVADAGLRNFLGRVDIAGPSSQVTADEIFLATEYYSLFFLFLKKFFLFNEWLQEGSHPRNLYLMSSYPWLLCYSWG
jgi:serine/threonine protein kinase